ncbi:MAG: hypothetical protein QJR03_15970 [Sphaerobacter sp.]|nr:hypothetical protein [Sphaerobacter sp.]
MDRREPDARTLAAIVGIAAASAAAVGGLVAALLQRRRPAPPPPATGPFPALSALLKEPRLRPMAEAARRALEQTRARVEAADADEMRREVAQRVAPLVEGVRSELPEVSREVAQLALQAAERLRSEGAERSAELSERLRAEVEPAARTLAQEAVEEAEAILEAARMRAAEVSQSARAQYLPHLSARASAMTGAAAGALAGAAQTLGARTRTLAPRRRRGAPRMAERGRATLQRAGTRALSAATETVLIAFWASALGAVVYFGLLNPEQRARVRRAVASWYCSVRSFVAEFRGQQA